MSLLTTLSLTRIRSPACEPLDERITAEDEDVRLEKFRHLLALSMKEEESNAISDKLTLFSLFPLVRKSLEIEAELVTGLTLSKVFDDSDSLAIDEVILSQKKYLGDYCPMEEVIQDIYRSEMNRVTSSGSGKLNPHKLRALKALTEMNDEGLQEVLSSLDSTREESSSQTCKMRIQFARMVTRYVSDVLKPKAIASVASFEQQYVEEVVDDAKSETIAHREREERAARDKTAQE